MSDVLCIYYSRTGITAKAMEEIGRALDAEVVAIRDGAARRGLMGALRCGLDAMKKDCAPVRSFETERPLEDYRLVILGTPVWAGRCSSVIRSFLKAYGNKLDRVGYVVTRCSEGRYEDIYRQMDGYTNADHVCAVSLRDGSVGYCFWQEEFLRQAREYLAQEQ